jgi:hypothetical protein
LHQSTAAFLLDAVRMPPCRRSIDPFTHRARQLGVAGVDGRMGLQEHQVGLPNSDRAVTNPSGDHKQLPRAQHDVIAVLQLDAQLARGDEEDFIGLVVLVPTNSPRTLTSLTS